MSEEKKPEIVTLHGNNTKYRQTGVTTTYETPEVTDQVKISGLQTPEGQAEAERAKNEVYKAYDLDENGKFDQKRVGELLGFDPEVYKKEQEAQERLERFKKKEAGWRNALGVIGDIVTASAGGNVYERKPDTVAKEAAANEQKAHENIINIGNSVPRVIAAREKEAQDALAKRLDNIADKFSVTRTTKQQGNKTVDKQYGQFNESYTRQQQARQSKSMQGAQWGVSQVTDKNSYVMRYNTVGADGNPVDSYEILVPKNIGETYARNIYDRMLKIAEEVPEVEQYLINKKIVMRTKNGVLAPAKDRLDFKQLLAAGWIYDDEYIKGQMEAIVNDAVANGQLTQAQADNIFNNIEKIRLEHTEKKEEPSRIQKLINWLVPEDEDAAPATTSTAPAKTAPSGSRGRSKSDKEKAAEAPANRNSER